MKRILVYALTWRRGGIESFFLNYSNRLSNVQLDFIKLTPNELSFENELKKGRIFYLPRTKENIILRKRKIKEIFDKNKYDALWFNSNDLASVDIIKEAHQRGIKCIIHAHNSKANSFSRILRHKINRKIDENLFDAKFACSELAAKWFFPNCDDVSLIYNAINIDKYFFNHSSRRKIRGKFGISEESIVLGDIGRLEKQKNFGYLIDVFAKYHQKKSNSYLMIVGEGSLKKELSEHANQLGISDFVLFVGEVNNVEDYLSAFDIFAMPSLYEGLPVTLVEAQASGLQCLVSNTVTDEVNVTGNISYYPIDEEDIDKWVNNIKISGDRLANEKKVKKTVFDISISAAELESKILEVISK